MGYALFWAELLVVTCLAVATTTACAARLRGVALRWLLAVGGVVASVLTLLRRLIGGGSGVTIPVAIDAVRDVEGVPMARSTYFVATELPPSSVSRRLRGSPAFFPLDGLLILAESIDDAERMRDVLDRIEDAVDDPRLLDGGGPIRVLIELTVAVGGPWDPPSVDYVQLKWDH